MRYSVSGTFTVDVHTIIHADSIEEALAEAKSMSAAAFDDAQSEGFTATHIAPYGHDEASL